MEDKPAESGFQWISYKGGERPIYAGESRALARQHVMLDYLQKQSRDKRRSSTPGPSSNMSQAAGPPETEDDNRSTPPRQTRQKSLMARWKVAARPKSGQVQVNKAQEMSLTRNLLPASPTPQASAVCQYPTLDATPLSSLDEAVWWHFYKPRLPGDVFEPSWMKVVRQHWLAASYGLVNQGEARLNIFMCLSYLKKAAATRRSIDDSYYSKKGRALELTRNELRDRGQKLEAISIGTIGLHAMLAMEEGDVDAAELHIQAAHRLVKGRWKAVPLPEWEQINNVDLHLCAISNRNPILAHHEISNYAPEAALPSHLALQIRQYAISNVASLPLSDHFTAEVAEEEMFKLHRSCVQSMLDETDNLEGVRHQGYDQLLYMSYLFRPERNQHPDTFDACDAVVQATCIEEYACEMAFTSMETVHLPVIQRLYRNLSATDDLCESWKVAGGRLESLVWILFATCTVADAYETKLASERTWFAGQLRTVLGNVRMTTSEEVEALLQEWPIGQHWIEKQDTAFWIELGVAPPTQRSESSV